MKSDEEGPKSDPIWSSPHALLMTAFRQALPEWGDVVSTEVVVLPLQSFQIPSILSPMTVAQLLGAVQHSFDAPPYSQSTSLNCPPMSTTFPAYEKMILLL